MPQRPRQQVLAVILVVTSVVPPAWDPVFMPDWKELANYGAPGLLITAIVYLAAKLIERGFTFRVPPEER